MSSRFTPRAPTLGEHVPIEGHLTNRVLRLSDDGVYAMLALNGLPSADTAGDTDLLERVDRLNGTHMGVPAGDRMVMSIYLCRSLADPTVVPEPDPRLTPFARTFGAGYRERLLDGLLYENRLYLGLHLRPAAGGGAEWWARRKARKRGADAAGERAIDRARHLERICDWLASELADYGPRPLGLAERGKGVFSEIGEALAFAATGVWRPVPLTTGRLAEAMFAEEVAFHYETVELRGPGYTQFAAVLTFKGYPAATYPGMLAAVERAPFRCTLLHHFEPLPQSGGIGLLTRQQNKMVWAGDKARSQIAELDEAADRVASGRMAMGAHSVSLAVFSDRAGGALPWYRRFATALQGAGLGSVAAASVEAALDDATGGPGRNPLDDVVNAAWKTLANCAAAVARENKALMAAWLSQLAGNHRLRARPGALSTRNLAAMAPLHGPARGVAVSRWGPAIITLRTTAGTAYPFHWHDGEGDDAVGNTLITGETGSGKAQPLDARVLTPTGWRAMGDLAVGDQVTCPDGRVAAVTGVYPQGEKEIWRISFEDGRSVECCDDHLWKVWEWRVVYETGKGHADRRPINKGAHWSVLPLRRIRTWFEGSGRKGRRAAMPLVDPCAIEFPPQDLPVQPYALGALIGDGDLSGRTMKISTADAAILDRLLAELPDYEAKLVGGQTVDYRLRMKVLRRHSPLRDALLQLGLCGMKAHEKFVPEVYKRSSAAQRMALLQGLLDTDGSVGNGTHATFTSTSERLALDVQEIAWSLGAIAKLVQRQTHFRRNGDRMPGRPSWRVSIVHPDISCFFSLPRKVAQCVRKEMRHRLRIRSIERVGMKPAQCIAVDHPDRLYVTDQYVVTHNTTLVGALIACTAGRADVVGLDHKQGWRVLFGHLGAPYAVMGGGNPMFAPLKGLDPTPANLDFLLDLLRGCIVQGGWRDLTPEEERLLALGIRTVMENPPEHRQLAEVAAFLAPDVDVDGAGARLLKWCWGGELGWVLDAPRDALDLSGGTVGLDATDILKNGRAAAPTLLYLFHRIGLHLDGRRRLLLPVDEGWRVLEDPAFYRPIAAQLRTIRSKNGVVVFITQSPSDAANSPIAAELLEQCPNQIHLPNPRASEEDYVGRLKRTPGEFAALRALGKGSGQFLVCKGRESLVAELRLRGLPQLAALSASEAALRAYEALPDEVRADPRRLEHEFRRRRAAAEEEIPA